MHTQMEQKLKKALLADPIFQQLLEDCLAAEAEYLRIWSKLPPEDRCILDRYLSLCDETEHRKLSLLLEIASRR